MSIKTDRFLRALLRQPVDKTPVWIMRQAGRYLPEYRAVRAKAGSFMALCQTPELACEVTLQPLARFDLDAAIIFSDILTIPDAMGLQLSFAEGQGPRFAQTIRTAREVAKLGIPDPETDLRYVLDAIRLVKKELNGLPLIGFCGSPWTIACYMVEGTSNKAFPHIKALCKESPAVLHQLLTLLSDSIALHLNAQIAAGADAVMIFDSWGGMLSTEDYITFSLPYVTQIIQNLSRTHAGKTIPRILFTREGSKWLEKMLDSGCDALGVDWQVSLAETRARVGGQVALQGNLNPAVLKESPETIQNAVAKILAEYGKGSGHVFNLGHGITPDISPEHVKILVDAVHELSIPYHLG